MNRLLLASLALAGVAAGAAQADYKVTMNAIDAKGVGASIGTITIKEAGTGVAFQPDLKGLPPGTHGFHIHSFANCAAKEKDGKLEPGEAAGPHWDPGKAAKHGAPGAEGHRGDLTPIVVASDGTAQSTVNAPYIKLASLKGKALMIHAGGDNFSDQPKPNGGGGTRIACGTVEK
jgi:Cu-Zn family superoxide dismutase